MSLLARECSYPLAPITRYFREVFKIAPCYAGISSRTIPAKRVLFITLWPVSEAHGSEGVHSASILTLTFLALQVLHPRLLFLNALRGSGRTRSPCPLDVSGNNLSNPASSSWRLGSSTLMDGRIDLYASLGDWRRRSRLPGIAFWIDA